MLNVSEQFYSIQGEGLSTGAPSYFVRLRGCNILCGGKGTEKDGLLHDGATWRCDTMEVWLKGTTKTVDEIIAGFGINIEPNAHLIITGGEPLLQQSHLPELITAMLPVVTEIETNGTVLPTYDMLRLVDQWNVSPKLANSGVPKSKRLNPAVIEVLKEARSCQFKFVVSNRAEVEEAILEYIYPLKIKRSQVWLMPAAENIEELTRVSPPVAELAKEYGFNFSSRLHITLWNKKTGV